MALCAISIFSDGIQENGINKKLARSKSSRALDKMLRTSERLFVCLRERNFSYPFSTELLTNNNTGTVMQQIVIKVPIIHLRCRCVQRRTSREDLRIISPYGSLRANISGYFFRETIWLYRRISSAPYGISSSGTRSITWGLGVSPRTFCCHGFGSIISLRARSSVQSVENRSISSFFEIEKSRWGRCCCISSIRFPERACRIGCASESGNILAISSILHNPLRISR